VDHLLFVAAVLVAAGAFAMLEIQIEGEDGWGAALPTWRVENRWTRWFFGGRPFTGYHLWVHVFIVWVVHLPFLLALAPFGWAAEARVLAFLVFFWIAEDFLWFVLNPAFGLRRFRREHIWWHAPGWWWIMPREYWLFAPVGLALYLAGRMA
jgi:hypothetical protein